jgi:hypothetical protein
VVRTDLYCVGQALGLELEGVVECVHVFDGRPRTSPLEVWLRFGKSRWLHLRCATDGESLSIDEQEPGDDSYSMGELGQIEYRDNTQTERYRRWVGQRCEAAWTATFDPGRAVAGLRLQLGNRDPLMIFNWGDDLYVRSQYPSGSIPVETPV